MHSAATEGMLGSVGSGRMAFAHSATILPGVSAPSKVVRAMQRIARSRAHNLASRLIERFASDAARSSSPTASTARVPATRAAAWAEANRGLPEAAAARWMSVDEVATVAPTGEEGIYASAG